MKKTYLTFALLLASASMMAQTVYTNAELSSTSDVIGTARYVGMGGALGALGADISAIGSNPAAIGMYRRSDIALTAGGMWQKDRTYHERNTGRGTFDQMGFVAAFRIDHPKVNFVNFSFNYQKKYNFGGAYYADNARLGGLSQADQFASLANAYYNEESSPYTLYGAAYDAYLYLVDELFTREELQQQLCDLYSASRFEDVKDQTTFERLIKLPDGVVLVTGPTGSGKTTTLYACLGQINTPDKKLITVEDPVEYQMSGINQVQVNKDVGLDFSAALRSILRQAPNIVMIGEIRDAETADIAMEAALTGHLVFSTLHTNDAPSAVTRLLDIGVKPFLVASALRAAMAQRLVRAICENCKESYTPTERELKMLGAISKTIPENMYHGAGCDRCGKSGYKGRKGIFEIFKVDDTIQRLIFDHAPATILRERAREMGMRTLREDGMLKVASGMTSLSEILRVTMGDAD